MAYRNQTIKLLLALIILAIVAFSLHLLSDFLIREVKPLAPYVDYLDLAIDAAIVGIGGYIIIRVLQKLISIYLLSKVETSTAHTLSLFLNIALYSILVLAILAALGVNLTGAAIGGAIGGIAIGLAAQTFLSNILSGLMVTSSKTLKPGDAISLSSWIWGSPIIGETQKVSILFTEVKTIYGNIVKIPNSAFLGNTVFTKLEGSNSLLYSFQVTVNADVAANQVLTKAENYIKDDFSKLKLTFPEIYFSGKNGGTNTFTVILHFQNLADLNKLLDLINEAFDKAYWDSKKQ
jgi:small-conductance mechanosensitive channel